MFKRTSFVIGSAFLVLSILAPAATVPATPDAATLGVLEGVINFCGKVNPAAANTYHQIGTQLTSGLTANAVTQLRNSKDYQNAQSKISEVLSELSTKQAIAACTAAK